MAKRRKRRPPRGTEVQTEEQRDVESGSPRGHSSRADSSRADSSRPEPRRRRRRRRAWTRWLLIAVVVLTVFTAMAPSLLRPWIVVRIRQTLPGHSEIGKLHLAWWAPIRLEDLQVSPDADQPMLKIGEVRTTATLWNIAMRRTISQLHVSKCVVDIRHRKKSSNLEEWLAAFPPSENSQQPLTVEIEDSTVRVYSATTAAAPAELRDVAGTVKITGQQYTVATTAKQGDTAVLADLELDLSENSTRFDATAVDLQLVEPWLTRQDVVGQLRGRVDRAVGRATWGDQSLAAELDDLQIRDLDARLPQLGLQPFNLRQLTSSLSLEYADRELRADGTLDCELGTLVCSGFHATLPTAKHANVASWKTVVQPIRGEMVVDLDLARTLQVLPWILPVRDNLRVTAGRAKIELRGGTESHERLSGSVALRDMAAQAGEQQLQWEKPVLLALDVRRDQGIQLENLQLDSEFLVARFHGTWESGNGTISGDLDKLHTELSRWLELPVEKIGGQITGDLVWEADGAQEIIVSGELDIVDAFVQVPGRSPWSDARVHLGWGSHAVLSHSGVPAMKSATLKVTTSQEDRIDWNARPQQDALQWNGELQLALAHLPRSVLQNGSIAEISGTLHATAHGRTTGKSIEIQQLAATVDQLYVRGDQILVREPTVILRGTGTVPRPTTGVKLDSYEFTSTTIAFGGKDLSFSWAPAIAMTAKTAVRSDLSKLDRWIPALQNDRYRWGGEFVGNVDIQLDQANSNGPSSTGASVIGGTKVGWSGDIDNFVVREVSIGGIPAGADSANDVIWQEHVLATSGSIDWTGKRLDVQCTAAGDAVQFTLGGNVQPPLTTPVVDLEGEIGYDYARLQPTLRSLLGPSIEIAGTGRQPIRVQGPILANTSDDAQQAPSERPMVNPRLTASASVDWESAKGYGIAIGPGEIRARLADATVTFSPLDFPLAEGRLQAEPSIDLRSSPGRVVLKPGPIMQKVNITPQMCRTWIRYAAPLLANATQAEGQLTTVIDHAQLPLGNPQGATAMGTIVIHQGRAGAGPLVKEMLVIASQVRALVRQEPPRFDPDASSRWVTIPQQEIDFRLAEGAVTHQRFEVRVKDVQLITSGTVRTDQTIQLVCEVPIQDGWVQTNRLLGALRGTTLRIPISGTLSQPKIDSRVLGDLGKRMLRGATEDLLRNQLEKGLRDLFK